MTLEMAVVVMRMLTTPVTVVVVGTFAFVVH